MSGSITLAADVEARGDAVRAETGTGVVFRHYGFGDGYPEADLGHTAQTPVAAYLASRSMMPAQ